MSSVLSKRYTNPSADIIDVLAGLDSVDKLMSDLSNGLDTIMKTGVRGKQVFRLGDICVLVQRSGKSLSWTLPTTKSRTSNSFCKMIQVCAHMVSTMLILDRFAQEKSSQDMSRPGCRRLPDDTCIIFHSPRPVFRTDEGIMPSCLRNEYY